MTRTRAGIARLIAAGALALAVAAPASADNHAMVRVLHASPDAPAVDVYLDDQPVDALVNVPFGAISDYLEVPSGDHNVKVYATGTTSDPVIDADVSLTAGGSYTIAATDALASITPQVIEDDPSPTGDAAQVRVVHLSADAPAVDIAPAGAPVEDALVSDLAYPDATGYLDLPGGTYDLEVRPAGDTAVALALDGVTIEDGTAYSVFAIGSAADPAVGGNALQAVVAVDATAAEEPGAGSGEEPGAGEEPNITPPATDTVGATETPVTTGTSLIAIAAVLAAAVGSSLLVLRRRPVRADDR